MLEQYLPETSLAVSWCAVVIGALLLAYAVYPPLFRKVIPCQEDAGGDRRDEVLQKMRTLQHLIRTLNPDRPDREHLVRITELGETLMRLGFGPEKCRETGNFDSKEWRVHLNFAIPYVEERGIRGALEKFEKDRNG